MKTPPLSLELIARPLPSLGSCGRCVVELDVDVRFGALDGVHQALLCKDRDHVADEEVLVLLSSLDEGLLAVVEDRGHAERTRQSLALIDGAGDDDRHTPESLDAAVSDGDKSEEHTSELQSRGHLVCRLL